VATRFTLEEGEAVLAEAECRSHKGPLAISGVATLTDHRLHFLPNLLDRAAGASAWQMSVGAIERAELKGLDKILEIHAGVQTRKISGKGTGPLIGRLQDLIAEKDGLVTAETLFEPGERIILQGDAELMVTKRVSTTGELVVTDRRVRFVPARRLETFIFKAELVEFRLTDIRRAKMDGVRRLEIAVGEGQYVFGGGLTPRMYGVLVVLCDRSGLRGFVNMWSTTLHKGPLAQKGELALGYSRLVFTPSGALDGAVGINDPVNLPLAKVTRVGLKGLLEKQIRLCVGAKDYVFGLAEPRERVLDYLPLLMRVSGKKEPTKFGFGKAIPQKAISKYLSAWPEIGTIRPRDIHAFEAAVEFQDDGPSVRRGWLCLTTWQIIFVPIGGSKGVERPTVLAVDPTRVQEREKAQVPDNPLDSSFDVDEVDLEDEEDDDLRLSAGGVSMHVFPRTGDRFVFRFKRKLSQLQAQGRKDAGTKQVQDASPAGAEADDVARSRISEIRTEEEKVIKRGRELKQALAEASGDSEVVNDLKKEIRVLQAELQALKAQRAVEEARLEPPDDAPEEASPDEGEAEATEQRGAFRVRLKPTPTVQLRDTEATTGSKFINARLRDLSTTGCSVMAREFLQIGDSFVFVVDISPNPGPVMVTVVYGSSMWKGLWRYGLKFESLSADSHTNLSALVIRLQRDSIKRLATGD